MSGLREIEASVSPTRILAGGSEQLLVRVQIVDLDSPEDAAAHAFIDLRSTCARRLALEILAAADDADWQTEQDGCPKAVTMSGDRATPTAIVPPVPALPPRVRALNTRLAALLETDQEIVARLNDAHQLLARANDRLLSGPAADLLRVHQQTDRAFWVYQQASEQRRQLAVEVGELSQQLTDALTAAGHPPGHARAANVDQLAAGAWPAVDGERRNR